MLYSIGIMVNRPTIIAVDIDRQVANPGQTAVVIGKAGAPKEDR